MICGTFTISDVPEDQLVQTMRGFSVNDPPPRSVTFRTEADGSNTVIAEFAPCAQQVSHDPAPPPPPAAPPTPSGHSAATPARAPSTIQSAKQAFQILTANNTWSTAQACGIIANIEAESNFSKDAIGDAGTAFGICQWHSDRQRNFKSHFGHDIQSSTFEEQVRFILFEMLQGTEVGAGRHLKSTSTAQDAGRAVSLFYERPKDPNGAVANHRGDRATAWFGILT